MPALQDQLLQLWQVPSTRELAREGGNVGAHALQGVQVADQGGEAGPEGDRAPLRHEAHRQHRQEGWGCAVVVFSSTIMLYSKESHLLFAHAHFSWPIKI